MNKHQHFMQSNHYFHLFLQKWPFLPGPNQASLFPHPVSQAISGSLLTGHQSKPHSVLFSFLYPFYYLTQYQWFESILCSSLAGKNMHISMKNNELWWPRKFNIGYYLFRKWQHHKQSIFLLSVCWFFIKPAGYTSM